MPPLADSNDRTSLAGYTERILALEAALARLGHPVASIATRDLGKVGFLGRVRAEHVERTVQAELDCDPADLGGGPCTATALEGARDDLGADAPEGSDPWLDETGARIDVLAVDAEELVAIVAGLESRKARILKGRS